MQTNIARVARWRERAEEYRVCAEACTSAGTQLAYRALAECAKDVADRMEQGTLTLRMLGAPAPKAARRPA